MTTVFIDFKEQKIVADKCTTVTFFEGGTLSTSGGSNYRGTDYRPTDKIMVTNNNVYITGAGDKSEFHRQCLSWNRKEGLVEPKADNVTLAIVRTKGGSLSVDLYKTKPYRKWWGKSALKWVKSTHNSNINYITFGSGGEYARGAYEAGVCAEDAVRAASRCDPSTSYEIDVIDFKEVL